MRISIGAAAIATAIALVASPLPAQTVDAGVVIQSGPVSGHVVVGEPPPVVVYQAPVREVIIVEHVHVPRGNAHGWWKHHGYRPVTLYYNGDSYYRRRFEGDVQLREIVVYEREGHYYDAWEEHQHGDGHHHEHGDGHHGDDDD